jgi:lipopolysaccharide biosynthesis glycosyltransferase
MDTESRITIAVATDNNYSILLAALLKSIEVNHKTPEKIDVYVIDDGISAGNIRKLKSQVTGDIITLHWLKSSEIIPADIRMPLDSSAFPVTAYMRVLAPNALPASVNKMIYLDVDMIVQEDISKLWHIDLRDHIFGAVIDFAEVVSTSWAGIPNYKELGMAPDTKYFNSGMMLINIEKWKAANITRRVMDCVHENLENVRMADQYGLNVVLVNQWLEIDRRWNTYSVLDKKDPYLIHFLDIKPIFKSYNLNEDYKNEFYKYLRLTAWKNYKPVSDYRRLVWKVYTKLKKITLRLGTRLKLSHA